MLEKEKKKKKEKGYSMGQTSHIFRMQVIYLNAS